MTFEEFKEIAENGNKPPQWRRGQWAFNTLAQLRPDIVEYVRGRFGIDPFHTDEHLPNFFVVVKEHWNV